MFFVAFVLALTPWLQMKVPSSQEAMAIVVAFAVIG